MHKDHRQGVDTRDAFVTGLRRREVERDEAADATPSADPADVPPWATVAADPSGTSPTLPSSPAGHRYWVPGPIRRLALHMRRYFTEPLRHDLYVHIERSTAALIDKLVAENQETRGQLRRLSATLDDLSRQSRVTGEPAAQARPGAIREARDDIAHSAETLRRELAKAVDALQAYGRRDDIPEEVREEVRALADQVSRLTAHQTAILSRLDRVLGEGVNESARVSRQ